MPGPINAMLDTLKTLDVMALPSFFADESQVARDVRVELDDDRRHERTGGQRSYLNALAVSNAAKLLDKLPAAGESLHCVMKGNFSAWDLVPAVLDLAGCKCQGLYVATLGFNQKVTAELLDLLDRGAVGEVAFVCSCYFRSTGGNLFEELHQGLTARGQRCVAIRSHAKLILFAMDDGRRFVIESSANLRSCRNIEQFTLTHATDLHDFHRTWLDHVIERAT